jgi:hypothetical protein
MKHKTQLLILLLLLFVQKNFAQYYSFEKIPKWVKTIAIPESSSFSKYDIVTGYYSKLIDYQVNLEENSVFNREVINVVSYSGISNASQLSVSLDTSYQKLKIHYLYIWRKGEKIDRTSELSFKMMNSEHKLQQGIYTGLLSAYDILNDIRKDDLIDFAYTLVGKNPIFNNEKSVIIPLESMNPIDYFSFHVLYKKEKDYNYKCVDCDSLISSSEINDFHQIEIQSRDIKGMKPEDNMPSWIMPYKYFILSSFKSWKDVNSWAQSVFALNSNPDLDNVFKEIFSGKETTDEKINKIINYVQDEIRYMGNESGLGSIKPHSPELVVKQRYGDCKDKSLLLVTLLKKIGIKEVYPALVNTQLQKEVDKLGPSNEIFNHCIVTFRYNDSIYWVDPSIPMQGGDFKDISVIDFGKTLIIGIPADTLQLMSPKKIESRTDVVDEYTIKSFSEPAKLKMTSTRIGFDADNRRLVVEYFGTKKLLEIVEKVLKSQFPVVNQTADMEVTDDIEKNKLTLSYNYTINGFWQDGDKTNNEATKGLWVFRYDPVMLYEDFKESVCNERKYDAILNYPVNLNYRVIFHLPKDFIISDNYYLCDNEAFYYDEKTEQLSSSSFQIDYKYRTKCNTIKAKDYKKICEQRNKIAKRLPMAIYFAK